MPLSIKQKQVLGVTSIVVLVVVSLSVLQLMFLTRIAAAAESAARRADRHERSTTARSEVVTARRRPIRICAAIPGVRATLESALYSEDVAYAAIVDPNGIVIAHSDRVAHRRAAAERRRSRGADRAGGFTQLRSIYQTDRMLEWRQPMLLGDTPFAEIRVGLSTLLVRRS